MAYYTKVLQPDEEVKVIGRLHWSIYLRGFIVLIAAIALLVLSQRLPDADGQRIALWAPRRSGRSGFCCCSAPGSGGARPRSW